ncbi:MAG TPA: RNA 3'-terminal phosphate cyclase, partial [Chloroflexi bacterium]|nr:RNA 3'-terminal phosphate cyclase [Chloroflexota bacterium]
MIEIDGSLGEGGGQVLRSALALAALTKQDVRIFNIRAGRKKPGLRPQHLKSVDAVMSICGGAVEGFEIDS